MSNINEIYWLAGWLEGEGLFTIRAENEYRQFGIEYSCTDLDIVQKVNKILRNQSRIFSRKKRVTANGVICKQEYYCKLFNRQAIEWMMTIFPLMGRRRKDKIKEIILEWKNYIQNGSGLYRKCRGPLTRTEIKSGWNKGKRQTYCRNCH